MWFFSEELGWKAYSLWHRIEWPPCSLYSPQQLRRHSVLTHAHMHTFTLRGCRWHEAYPHFLAPGISRISGLITSSLTQAARVCVCVRVCLCIRAQYDMPRSVCVSVCVCQVLMRLLRQGSLNLWSTTERLTVLMQTSVRHPQEPNRDKHCLSDGGNRCTPSDRSGTEDTKWWALIPNSLESGVCVCSFVCASLSISENVYVTIMFVSVHVTQSVCACGSRRELWGQRGVQCVRGLRAPALWFHSLAALRISSPVSQCWAHAGQREPRQENLCWCQQWKHHYPSTTSQNICQTAVCPFFLSLLRSLLSPWIFPFLLMYVSEILNPCWRGVSHFTWLVVSAGTLVTQLSIGLLRGWASLGVSFKV